MSSLESEELLGSTDIKASTRLGIMFLPVWLDSSRYVISALAPNNPQFVQRPGPPIWWNGSFLPLPFPINHKMRLVGPASLRSWVEQLSIEGRTTIMLKAETEPSIAQVVMPERDPPAVTAGTW